jgi:hypothetical protein
VVERAMAFSHLADNLHADAAVSPARTAFGPGDRGLLRCRRIVTVAEALAMIGAHVRQRDEVPLVGWLNGSIQSYTYILPKDYKDRLVSLPPFGRVRARLLGRRDVILMKVYAMRARDVEDLRAIRPTVEELAFVREQIPSLGEKEPEKARDMVAFLDEWSE